MSHLVLMTRGIKHEVDRFINELSTRYLGTKLRHPQTGMPYSDYLQVRVSPIQLWDISFPDHHMDAMLTTCLAGGTGKGNPSKHVDKFVWGLRKAMKLNKIPDYQKNQIIIMKQPENIELIGIGVKDDYWVEPDGRKVSKAEKSENATEGI